MFMGILDFAATVILVTVSGALAPGPLFFANISKGAELGAKSGLIFAVAHTLVEFTLVMLLSFGLFVINSALVRTVIGIAGGIVLIGFGLMQVYSALGPKSEGVAGKGRASSHRLLLLGLALTGLNPFFLVWWLTAGAQLIVTALELASLAGVLFMYVCHIWMDYVWLAATAHLAKKGMKVIGLKWYRILIGVFGFVLVYFGSTFLINSIPV
jgi:threonine/homoserine/homoserine lactone efflux protein